MIWLRVNGIPQAKGSIRAFMQRGMAECRECGAYMECAVGFPILTSTNKDLKPWERAIRVTAMEHTLKPVDGPVELTVLFEMRKPVKHPKVKQVPHTKQPDLDKLVRAVNDALIGVAYHNDSQVVSISAHKFYGSQPGVMIGIQAHSPQDAHAGGQ